MFFNYGALKLTKMRPDINATMGEVAFCFLIVLFSRFTVYCITTTAEWIRGKSATPSCDRGEFQPAVFPWVEN